MQQNVAEPLKTIIGKFAPRRIGDIQLTANTMLVDEVGIDSPRMIDILLDIEDEFKITIEEGAFQNVKTFGDLVGLVSSRVEASV
jgi:acyl carrier protein